MPDITTQSLVDIMVTIPEKRFRISELAPRLIDAKGQILVGECLDQAVELDGALAEIKNYIADSLRMRNNLIGLGASRYNHNNFEDAIAELLTDTDEDEDGLDDD